jgi:hypothetical protein
MFLIFVRSSTFLRSSTFEILLRKSKLCVYKNQRISENDNCLTFYFNSLIQLFDKKDVCPPPQKKMVQKTAKNWSTNDCYFTKNKLSIFSCFAFWKNTILAKV